MEKFEPSNASNEDGASLSPKKSNKELEAKFGSLNPLYNSIAAAAVVALGAVGNAQAGGAMEVKMDTPQISRVKTELAATGNKQFSIAQGMWSAVLSVDGGDVTLFQGTSKKTVEEIFDGVSAKRVLKEMAIEKRAMDDDGVMEELSTQYGTFKISITPFASAFLKEHNVTYTKGKLSNGRKSIDLSGSGSDMPNIECAIDRAEVSFKDYVIAKCSQLKMIGGKPQVSSVSYKIQGQDLGMEKINR